MRYWVDTVIPEPKSVRSFAEYFVTLRDARQACRERKTRYTGTSYIYRIDDEGAKHYVESFKHSREEAQWKR